LVGGVTAGAEWAAEAGAVFIGVAAARDAWERVLLTGAGVAGAFCAMFWRGAVLRELWFDVSCGVIRAAAVRASGALRCVLATGCGAGLLASRCQRTLCTLVVVLRTSVWMLVRLLLIVVF